MKHISPICILLIFAFCACSQEAKGPLEEEGSSGAYEALNFLGNQKIYPFEKMPSEGYARAFEQFQKSFGSQPPTKNNEEPWESLGPHNIGGRTLALAINPQNPTSIFVGSASGGLWKTETAGLGGSEAWNMVEVDQPVLGVSSIAMVPEDTTVMYIGTGEVYRYKKAGTSGADRATRGSYGMGILKTEDGGATWTKSLDWSYNSERGVQVVKIDPMNSNTIWAGTTEGTYKSTDAGESWTKVHDVLMVMDLAIHPENPDIVLLGCGNFASEGYGIYRTDDGGETWALITDDLPDYYEGKTMIDFSLSDPDIVYASIGNGFESANAASWLCRSEDAGVSWEVVNTNDYSKWQGWFAHDVAVHPENPDEIMVVGIDIWRSTNGGVNLNQISEGGVTLGDTPIDGPDGAPNFSHSDHHGIVYDIENPNIIYFINDGGIYVSEDAGLTFESRNGGYQTTQFYNGTSNAPYDSLLFMGGLQDNSTAIYEEDLAWRKMLGGDGAYNAFHPTIENRYYVGWQRLGMAITNNGGFSFNQFISPPGDNLATVFIAPYKLAPSNDDRLYAARTFLYRSDNGGSSWSTTNGGIALDGDTGNPVLSMDISYQDEDVIYAATAPYFGHHGIFFTDNGGDTWTDITSPELPDRYPNDLVVDPQNDATAYVVYSGFGTPHVFKTEDYGANWTAIGEILPDMPTNAVLVDPLDSDIIYIGNDMGVFVSNDAGNSWQFLDNGLPNPVMVMDLGISPLSRKLRAATHGNGTYQRPAIDLPVIADTITITQTDTITITETDTISIVEVDTIIQIDTIFADINSIPNETIAVNVAPNPITTFARFEYTLSSASNLNFSLYNQAGQQVKVLFDGVQTQGTHSLEWNRGTLSSGVYFYQLRTEKGTQMGQVVLL